MFNACQIKKIYSLVVKGMPNKPQGQGFENL